MRLLGAFLVFHAVNYASMTGCYLPLSPIQIFIESLHGYFILLTEPALFFGVLSIVFPVELIFRRCWPFLLPAIVLGTAYALIYSSYPEMIRGEISILSITEVIPYPPIFRLQCIILLFKVALMLFCFILYIRIFIVHFPKFLRNIFSDSEQLKGNGFIYFGIVLFYCSALYSLAPYIGSGMIAAIMIPEIGLGFIIYFVLYNNYRFIRTMSMDLFEFYFISFMVENNRLLALKILFPQKVIPKNIVNLLKDLNQYDKTDYLFQRLTNYFLAKKPYLQSNLSLDDIARSLNTNRTYISQVLKKKNTSFYDFVNSHRIAEAKERMKTNAFCLKTIAEDCGFSSYTTFIKYFEKQEGVSPKVWRDRHILRKFVQ